MANIVRLSARTSSGAAPSSNLHGKGTRPFIPVLLATGHEPWSPEATVAAQAEATTAEETEVTA
jgi:hypothetical protein